MVLARELVVICHGGRVLVTFEIGAVERGRDDMVHPARADEVPSLIFDEIDQGIGGRVGLVVGHKLWNLARTHQVFCVTHLPQLAVFGDQHYQVQKLIENKRTLTRVEKLDGEARLLELSQMLGEVGEGTLRSAHEILQTARQMIKDSKK